MMTWLLHKKAIRRSTSVRPSRRSATSRRPPARHLDLVRGLVADGDTSLGRILVASSGKGPVSILMGEAEELTIEDLQRRFPGAQLVRGDGEEDRHRLEPVLAFAEDPYRGPELAPDVRGTDFQRRVWQALREIPVGQASCRSAATCSSPRRPAPPSRN